MDRWLVRSFVHSFIHPSIHYASSIVSKLYLIYNRIRSWWRLVNCTTEALRFETQQIIVNVSHCCVTRYSCDQWPCHWSKLKANSQYYCTIMRATSVRSSLHCFQAETGYRATGWKWKCRSIDLSYNVVRISTEGTFILSQCTCLTEAQAECGSTIPRLHSIVR